ncbi:MAG: hypothetical protein LBS86_04550 [Treponema sp.]|nr:hypothetical protein [Treponema sp.]
MSQGVREFFKGMGSLNLFPNAPDDIPDTNSYSAWDDVAEAFREAGDDLRWAINEQSKAPPQ